MKNHSRIEWLDGIRGISCVLIFLHHFCLIFYPAIHYGDAVPTMFYHIDTFLSQSPLSVIINGNFLVALFLTISGMVISLQVMDMEDKTKVADLIIKRYLRLVLPIIPIGILIYIMLYFELFTNLTVAEITHSIWANSFYHTKLTFPVILKSIFVDTIFIGSDILSTAFWMLSELFYGTFTSIILSAITWKYKKNVWLIYIVVVFSLFNHNNLQVAFVFGTLLAWLYRSISWKSNNYIFYFFLVAGLVLGGYPTGVVPTNFYRYFNFITAFDLHVLGAFFLLYSIKNIKLFQNFLSMGVFKFLGKISYSVYLLHIPLLFSISTSLFLYAQTYFSYSYCVLFSLILSFCILRTPTDGFAEQNGRVAERADCLNYS